MAPTPSILISSVSRKKKNPGRCLSETRASHSHKTWTEVSSSVPNLQQMGLLPSTIMHKCPLKVLCPVSRPITTLVWVLLKDNTRAPVAMSGSVINSRACLCVLRGPRQKSRCCFTIQRINFLLIFCLETPKKGSGATNRWAEPFLASLLATQCSPTALQEPSSPNSSWALWPLRIERIGFPETSVSTNQHFVTSQKGWDLAGRAVTVATLNNVGNHGKNKNSRNINDHRNLDNEENNSKNRNSATVMSEVTMLTVTLLEYSQLAWVFMWSVWYIGRILFEVVMR